MCMFLLSADGWPVTPPRLRTSVSAKLLKPNPLCCSFPIILTLLPTLFANILVLRTIPDVL